jgi:hypothetical protein
MKLFKAEPSVASRTDETTASLAESVALVQRQCAEILGQIAAMNDRLSELAVRESELRAVLERDADLEPHTAHLRQTLKKPGFPEHVRAAIDRAPLHLDPFPYTVIEDLLPSSLYRCALRGLPPVELFKSKPKGKQHLSVPFSLAPSYSHRPWRFIADDLVPNVIAPAIVEKFRAPIDEWIARNWPDLSPEEVALHGSGGRVMFRQRGYRIMPHRDPKWGFITCIFYLARRGDSEAWGTQLYAVDEDEDAKSAAPFWIDPKKCRCVEDVAFLPNRLLVFLNSTGAHGAHIPPDAQPETLERYIYQFRIGPTADAIAMLKSKLPEERQPLWSGKALVDY